MTATAKKNSLSTATVTWTRDKYGALVITVGPGANRSTLGRCWAEANRILKELEEDDVDEHQAPAWETGCAFDHKGRGEAINVAVYGCSFCHKQSLAVVQVRRYAKAHTNWWPSIRKNYFLIGRNERTKKAFAHPLPAGTVHAAIRRDPSPEYVVQAARAWIFEVPIEKLPRVLRHGDVAAVPVRSLPSGERKFVEDSPEGVSVVDSHVLHAAEIVQVRERLYARDPLLRHLKGQHADVTGKGWHRIQVGLRADYWKFAAPTAD